jgi:hypothetical protein
MASKLRPDQPEVIALRQLAIALADEGSTVLPAVNRAKRELLLFQQDEDETAAPALVVRAAEGRLLWGDPQRAHTFDEVGGAAKEIAYYLAENGS